MRSPASATPWDDKRCHGEHKSFGCRIFSATWRRGLASDPFSATLTPGERRALLEDMLDPLPRRVLVVLGSYQVRGDQLSATRADVPLLQDLRQRGFRASGASPPAGILGFSRRDETDAPTAAAP